MLLFDSGEQARLQDEVPRRVSGEICALCDITDTSAGGKAYGLARLVAMGLSVPPAFVLRNAQANCFPADLDTHYRNLRAASVAVRSSALGEDGIGASFAGQYDTVLNVCGEQPLRDAIARCVASIDGERARSYQQEHSGAAAITMNVVVQAMVDATVAGVVFTADPVSARRDLLLIDAIAGLGEALVSGEATPDHYAVHRSGDIVRRQLAGTLPLLSDADIARIATQARAAAVHEGHPLDLEWAIDADGTLYWLQARPITTLPADLNEFDTVLPRPDDVLTISNVSEMMPGAVCPLTGSFTGWGIDYGVQHMQLMVGARDRIEPAWQLTAWAYGHLFLNMTGNVAMNAAVLGATVEQTAQSLCGRLVPELRPLPRRPLWRRALNTVKVLAYCLRAPAVVARFDRDLQSFAIAHLGDSIAMSEQLARKAAFFDHAMAVHIRSSALSGFLCTLVESGVAARSNDSTGEEQAQAMRLLAGATGVESAVMLDELDGLIDRVAEHTEARDAFWQAAADDALTWLLASPELAPLYHAFIARHGHRGYRELCMRDQAWREDPTPLVQSMQAAVHARLLAPGPRAPRTHTIDRADLSASLRWLLPKAHAAIRRREHTKSRLVEVAHRFKLGFRHLGELLVSSGALPDADLVYFFSVAELPSFAASPDAASVERALARRAAFPYQQRFEFPEISVGIPQPLEPRAITTTGNILHGRPASRGTVEGLARVAHTLAEAAVLQPGEILVTPITDIGWTPYFSLIAGLVTDLGSAVSHGAVIAREYGLPCVVNTREGSRFLKTGDRIRLDGDNGTVERLWTAEREN